MTTSEPFLGIEKKLLSSSGVRLNRSTQRFYFDQLATGEKGLVAVRCFRIAGPKYFRKLDDSGTLDLGAKHRVPQEVVVVLTTGNLFILESGNCRKFASSTLQWSHSDVDAETGHHLVQCWDNNSTAQLDPILQTPADSVFLGFAHKSFELLNFHLSKGCDTP